MCGICGKVSLNNGADISEDLLRKMCQALKDRGPDDEGIYLKALRISGYQDIRVGLGHRRLSIIDLSIAGHQPMCNEDGTIWLTMNGEIYNFSELREALEKKGHRFKSRTDTEVILHLYEDKGTGCLRDLCGMFAFAICNENDGTIFLARDRIGKKPLFYAFKNGDLLFGSSLNALLQDECVGRDIELASIDDFLNYQYIPAPFTIFKEVKKLPPAHFLMWKKGEIKVERYWDLDYSKKLGLTEEDYCERVLDLLKECTKRRMVSDVPLGAFLSGGIDSSAIVGIMTQLMGRQVRTFSIGFEDASFNEMPFARLVSERFGTDHKEFVVKPDALKVLPELVVHFGEPYGDSSALPTYYLSKMTRQEVTVALNGDGGDEAFGGYERYIANRMIERYGLPLRLFKRFIGNIIKTLPETHHKKDKAGRLKRFLNIAGLDRIDRYAGLMAIFDKRERAAVYTAFARQEIEKTGRQNIILKAQRESRTDDLTDQMLYVDLMTYMPGDLLPKVDVTSMANSLEVRSPFLDHKFLEFAAQVPSCLKDKGFTTKYILKKALKRMLPPDVLKREKMGFGVPVGKWFRDELRDYSYEILLSQRSIKRGYFDSKAIRHILDMHISGKVNNGAKIWSLLNLELWHRIFLDKEKM